MGDAPTAELDALLDGGGWEVGDTFEGSPAPPAPVSLGRTACYVVMAVLFNEEGAVLLVQEAKPECRGRWYLPAGRMERGEGVVEALRREVKEESGLECEPITLLALEERGPAWIRFAFLARPAGECLGRGGTPGVASASIGGVPGTGARGVGVPCQPCNG
ncbi:nudix hydrolase 18 [Willisornis vidua]|uniref:Nudix hydrolase 18 n=1 Tax=Willisornis vidua TaxID=1566151 RepID=A0ABQ9DWG3_9PASS|nr:nudix hydrolase 18 [Willisornis vidua]